MMRRIAVAALCGALTALPAAGPAAAQNTRVLKMALFAPSTSNLAPIYAGYVKRFAAESGGSLKLELHYGASMGPTARHYQLVRDGVADMAMYHPALTPTIFPLTQVMHLPYLVHDAVHGAKMMMSVLPDLAAEHKGVHVLYIITSLPDNLFTASKPVRTAADLKGMRLRLASRPTAQMIVGLGAVPVGMPPTEMPEALQRGTIDGVITGLVGITAWQMGDLVKYRAPMFGTVNSFWTAMNARVYDSLTRQQKAIVDKISGVAEATRVAQVWNDAEDKAYIPYLRKHGIQDTKLDPALAQRMDALAAKASEAYVASLESKGLPARALYAKAKELSAKLAE